MPSEVYDKDQGAGNTQSSGSIPNRETNQDEMRELRELWKAEEFAGAGVGTSEKQESPLHISLCPFCKCGIPIDLAT